ncbi:MAG: hypothetical protein EG828_08105 [Deltaproteobacteria bacterium]|nr:hypothetical protein [Deltaproteobacteria bacterium]
MKGILRFFALPLILLAFGISLNGCGGGSSSSDDAVIPGIPSNVSATPGDTKVTVSWNAVPGASSYTIYYAETSDVMNNVNANKISATNSCVIDGLTNGTRYYFVVTAENTAGVSDESEEVSAIPIAKPKGSSAFPGDTEVVVYCQPVKFAASYNLYYSTDPDFDKTTYIKITDMNNPQTVPDLSNDTTYYFVITAVNDDGVEGPISSVAIATPSAIPQAPPSPTGVTVTGGPASITVKWYTSYEATDYRIYYMTPSTTSTLEVMTLGMSDTVSAEPFGVAATQTHIVSGLSAANSYSIVVTALKGINQSVGQETPKTTTPSS